MSTKYDTFVTQGDNYMQQLMTQMNSYDGELRKLALTFESSISVRSDAQIIRDLGMSEGVGAEAEVQRMRSEIIYATAALNRNEGVNSPPPASGEGLWIPFNSVSPWSTFIANVRC